MTERPEVSEFGSVDPAPPASNDENVEKLRDTLCDEGEKMFQRMRAVSYTHLTLPTTPYV